MDNSSQQPIQDPTNSTSEINIQQQSGVNGGPSLQPPITPNKPKKNALMFVGLGLLLLAIIIGLVLIISYPSKKAPAQSASANVCINKTIQQGASGNCVADVQTMINFLETDNLNECSFKGGESLTVNSNYDTLTAQQVEVVQNWLNCYNKQEGAPSNITTNGIVNPSTWSDICTYAYVYPKQAGQSSSPYYKESISAGKDAGC